MPDFEFLFCYKITKAISGIFLCAEVASFSYFFLSHFIYKNFDISMIVNYLLSVVSCLYISLSQMELTYLYISGFL